MTDEEVGQLAKTIAESTIGDMIDTIEHGAIGADATTKLRVLAQAMAGTIVACDAFDHDAAVGAAHLLIQWAIDNKWDGFEGVVSHLDVH